MIYVKLKGRDGNWECGVEKKCEDLFSGHYFVKLASEKANRGEFSFIQLFLNIFLSSTKITRLTSY